MNVQVRLAASKTHSATLLLSYEDHQSARLVEYYKVDISSKGLLSYGHTNDLNPRDKREGTYEGKFKPRCVCKK